MGNIFIRKKNYLIIKTISDRKKGNIISKISELLSTGEDINQNQNGITPLNLSIKFEDFKLTKFLLENGANEIAKDKDNQTPVDYAILGSNTKIMDLMFFNTEKNIQNSYYQNLLFEKSKNNKKRLSLYAIKRGAFLNKFHKYIFKMNALIIASMYGCTNVVKLLVKNNANTNLKDNFNLTGLMRACSIGHSKLVNLKS